MDLMLKKKKKFHLLSNSTNRGKNGEAKPWIAFFIRFSDYVN